MLPFITLGSLKISTYTLMYGLAFVLAGMMVLDRFKGDDRENRIRRTTLVIIVLFILVGLFLPSIAESYVKHWLTGEPLEPYHMRVYYGLGLGLLAGFIYIRRMKVAFLPMTDRAIPVFGLGFAIARIGCLAAGCCGGAVTTSFLSMWSADTAGVWAMRYPTQLMSMGFELLLFFGLTALEKDRPDWLKAGGSIFYLYIFLFCLERFSLEWLRADYKPLLGGLSLPHVYMLAAMVAAAGAMAVTIRRSHLQAA